MKKLWWLAAACVILSGCAEKNDREVVAVVGDREIPLTEITENFMQVGMPEFTSVEDELDAKKKYLDQRIEEALLVKAAYTHGLDTDIEILELVENERAKFLLDELFRVVIIEKCEVAEKEIREWYEHWFTKIRARHILVEDKARADSVRQAVLNGADFAQIARDISRDPLSRARGGDMGRHFGWGELVPDFQKVLFTMKTNEISQPVKTEYGWHIIEVLDIKEEGVMPLDSIRQVINSRIMAVKQEQRQREHRDELLKAYPIELVPETITFLREKIAEYAKIDTVVIADSLRRDVPLEFLSEMELEKPIAHYLGDQVMPLGHYLQLSNSRPAEAKPPLAQPELVNQFIFTNVLLELLLDQAHKLGLEEAPLYKTRLKEFTETVMADKLKNTILRRGISVGETELQEYFDSHPEEFLTEVRIHVNEILVADKATADDLYKQLRAGASFEDLARRHTTRKGYQRNGGDLGIVKPYRFPEIFEYAQNMKVGELSAPFLTQDDWSIIKILEREEPRPQDFATVKGELFTRLREERIDSSQVAYIDSLRAATPITIDEDKLAASVDHKKYE
jgi:foldase protein PrsA